MLLVRDELIAMLFQETDRAQRLKTGLAVIHCGICGWDGLRSQLDDRTLLEVEQEITERTTRFLRCYDSFGNLGNGEYCLILPGCNSFNAVGMAKRLNRHAFSTAVLAGAEELMIQGCFGIAGSGGRSPLVVLRNAENALRSARTRGAGSIVRSSFDAQPDPATLPILVSDELPAHG